MWKMKICKVAANLVLKIHSFFFFPEMSDRGIFTFYLVSFAGGKWESSVVPATGQCSKPWSHSCVRMKMLLASKAQLILLTWLLLAPHPSCGETPSRKDTAPRRPCCFSHWRCFITPRFMRAHHQCKGSGLRACACPSLHLVICLWGAEAHVHLWGENSPPHLLAWSITPGLVTWPW